MKIYAVFAGYHEDRELCAVFSDRKAAENYQQYLDYGNIIEELVLDSKTLPEWWDSKLNGWNCGCQLEKTANEVEYSLLYCCRWSPGDDGKELVGQAKPWSFDSMKLTVKVLAPDESSARDMASKHFDEWISNNAHIFQQ